MKAIEREVGGKHYLGMKVQPMELSLSLGLPADLHTAIKYVARYKAKNGREDLEKALHTVQLGRELKAQAKHNTAILVADFLDNEGFDDAQRQVLRAILDGDFDAVEMGINALISDLDKSRSRVAFASKGTPVAVAQVVRTLASARPTIKVPEVEQRLADEAPGLKSPKDATARLRVMGLTGGWLRAGHGVWTVDQERLAEWAEERETVIDRPTGVRWAEIGREFPVGSRLSQSSVSATVNTLCPDLNYDSCDRAAQRILRTLMVEGFVRKENGVLFMARAV